ncbi:MAG: YibE/F family protein [Oscillospiraceae bacterium]|nr:YibE/F family protein [Oscillospiraceae bacterium]
MKKASLNPTPPAGAAPERRLSKRLPAALILLAAGAVLLWLFLTAREGKIYNPSRLQSEFVTVEEAEVLNISYDTVSVDRDSVDGVEKGNQRALVRLRSGLFAGETREIYYMIGAFAGPKLRVGDRIAVLQVRDETDGALQELSYFQYDRSPMILAVLGFFVLTVLLVGGKTGLRSLLGLGVTVAALIWIFCPMWMKGASPVPLAMGLCAMVSVVSFVLLGGTSKKILCAILATLAGVALAAAFGALAQRLCRVTSYNLYDVNGEIADLVTLQTRSYPVRVHGILTAGILIAALGAVMDVAMSLSSALAELKRVNPALGPRELWRSGMNIGRDMVGTMTNTLILAFVGTSLVTVLRIWAQGPSWRMLLSSAYFSVELISALSSSIGVVLTVPLTAGVGALFFAGSRKAGEKPQN